MSTKIIPAFVGPLTANGLKVWLGRCEDGFDNYEDTHEKSTLSVKTRIRLTGSSLQEPQMAEWWDAGRTEYLALTTWDAFIKKLKDRWLPQGWKMDALENYYGCVQGKRDFRVFAADLAQCLNALPSGIISTVIHKHHLVFYSHQLLYLRMRAIPGWDIDDKTQTPDQLIALMSAQWDSLIADNASRGARSLQAPPVATPPSGVALMTSHLASSTSSSGPPRLSEEEKAALTAARGCWNCRGKPTDPGWVPHTRHTCPGNPTIGARPGRDYAAPATPSSSAPPVSAPAVVASIPYAYPAHSGAMAERAAAERAAVAAAILAEEPDTESDGEGRSDADDTDTSDSE